MSAESIGWLAIAVMGLVVGLGMLAVRADVNETARLSTVWPIARLYQYRWVRLVITILGLAFAALGVAGFMGLLR
jgi:hypothetical protein